MHSRRVKQDISNWTMIWRLITFDILPQNTTLLFQLSMPGADGFQAGKSHRLVASKVEPHLRVLRFCFNGKGIKRQAT